MEETNVETPPLPQSREGARSPASGKKRPKPPFGMKPFKQAVFFGKDNDDGSVQLHVSFQQKTPSNVGSSRLKQLDDLDKPVAVAQLGTKPVKPKPGQGVALYKDMVTTQDKKRMAEEIENLPKPDEIVQVERELVSCASIGEKFVVDKLDLFPCVGCDDVFPTEFSLQDHLERNSYLLHHECKHCNTKLTFYNKCKLHEHLVLHYPESKIERNSDAAKNTTILPLPKVNSSKLGEKSVGNGESGPPNDTAKQEREEKQESVSGELNKSNTLSSHDESNMSPKAANDEEVQSSEPTAVRKYPCTECPSLFETPDELAAHMMDSSNEPIHCIPCKMDLPSACSLRAHRRVHSLIEPFTCPECGVRMYKKNIFLKHLRLSCLHYSKLHEFLCPGCTESFNRAEDQLRHLKLTPGHLRFDGERHYYKCNGCPKAFKTFAAHGKHKSCPGAGCSVVHMCNNCPVQTVFRSFTELQSHREETHPELKWVPKRSAVYACYLCAHKTRTVSCLTEHLFRVHQKKKINFMCHMCGVETDTQQALDSHIEVCPFKEGGAGLKAHIVVERLPKLSSGSSVVSDNSSAAISGVNGSDSSEIISGSTMLNYYRHSQSFNCHLCTTKFKAYSQLRKHVIRRHEGRGLIYECWVCKEKGVSANFYRQRNLDKHMVDAHKIMILSLSEDGTDLPEQQDDDGPPAKRLRIYGEEQPYLCSRCDFSCSDALEFKTHIKAHKSSPDSHQCSECGVCFSANIALRRHLFAVHKVTDYARYSRQQYITEYEKQLNNTNGKCPVCERKFDDDNILKKHLRTHGMVYINTKRIVS